MFKIKTLNTIAAAGLNHFPHALYEISNLWEDPDAIILRSHSLHDNVLPPSLKAVGRAGTGLNNIPVEALTARGIPVFNTPGGNANAVRELVIAGMLLASRHICRAWDYVNRLEENTHNLNEEIEKNKKQFVGVELLGKTLGVIGLGSIGVKVANACLQLGMKVVGYDPNITVNRAWELSSEVKQAKQLEELLQAADFISIHIPLTPDTKHLINDTRLKIMKDQVVLLNFARESIIDPVALLQALNEKKIYSYVTDFPTVSLKAHPQVISLPHLGASTKEAEENCAVMVAKQIRLFLENGTLMNAVNFPSVQLNPIKEGSRLTIVNANIPNMVAQISSILADAGINIVSLINQSLKDIAYTVIDINDYFKEALIKEIANIQGVIQIRTLNKLVEN